MSNLFLRFSTSIAYLGLVTKGITLLLLSLVYLSSFLSMNSVADSAPTSQFFTSLGITVIPIFLGLVWSIHKWFTDGLIKKNGLRISYNKNNEDGSSSHYALTQTIIGLSGEIQSPTTWKLMEVRLLEGFLVVTALWLLISLFVFENHPVHRVLDAAGIACDLLPFCG